LQVSAAGTLEGSMTVRSPIWRRGGFDDLRSGCGRPKKTAETPERSKNSGDANRRGGITNLKLFEGPD
jgi:hypothetical protein